jgi:hypothetical protein
MSSIPPPQQPAPVQQPTQGLPPTGLQQQMSSLNNLYNNVQNASSGMRGGKPGDIGYNVRNQQFQTAQRSGASMLEQQTPSDISGAGAGSTSLDAMARQLAQRYGLPIGQGRLVDESGNFMYTPQQIADASGGRTTLGEAAAQMNYISQALTQRKNEQQQQKGIASMQAGMSQVQSRGRGSLASMMSGYYEGIADLYANQEYEAADYSFYIQKEQQEIAMQLQARQERLAKKQAQGQFWTGIGTTIVGLATGNAALIGYGATQIGGSAGSTGYF